MQELMARHKTYPINPRDCLKTALYQKWQRIISPPENARPPSKRRKRKSSNSATTGVNSTKKKNRYDLTTLLAISITLYPISVHQCSKKIMHQCHLDHQALP